MTTTLRCNQSRTRFLFVALASASLAASATLTPALTMSANAAAPSVTGDHRIVHHDARRDVLRFDVKSEASKPAPHNRATDITKTVVDHQAGRLVVRAKVRHLRRSGYRLMISEILTSDGRRYQLDVDYSKHPIDTRVSLRRFASGKDVKCPDATWSINRSADRVAAAIPNSCFGDPGWVRVGVALVAAPHNLKTSSVDDSRTRGRIDEQHLKLGPRQHRA